MVRLSNGVIAFFNTITLLISLVILTFSIWFFANPSSTCQKFLQQPLLFLGLSLFVVSFFGLIGSCCRVQFALWIYLFAMFMLILGITCFTVFSIVVTNKGVGQAISGKGYKEYRLGDYSNWLQNYVVNEEHWGDIKSCLIDAMICSRLGGNVVETAVEFNKRSLTPTQSGCCKPPTYCGFEFKNATSWTVPKTGPAAPDSDCKTWSNQQSTLCYDCKSCKAGVLANIKNDWRMLALINSAILGFVVIVYSVGCCALRSNRSYGRFKGYH